MSWIDLKGYEGLYMINKLGEVKSLYKTRGKEIILTPYKTVKGYLYYTLYKDGKKRNRNIHQLLAETYLGHIPDGFKSVVDHIDNNKLNNSLDNLQIISHRENVSKDKKGYTSKYPGVYWMKERNKWRAMIGINGKSKHIGLFDDEVEAYEAYKAYLP